MKNLSFKLYSINLSFSLEQFFHLKETTTFHVFAGFSTCNGAKNVHFISKVQNERNILHYIVENFLKSRCAKKTQQEVTKN